MVFRAEGRALSRRYDPVIVVAVTSFIIGGVAATATAAAAGLGASGEGENHCQQDCSAHLFYLSVE